MPKDEKSRKSKKSRKSSKSKKKGPTVEETYQHMSHHEHVLERPDSYVGSTRTNSEDMFVYDEDTKQMIKKSVNYNQALYKIFDEIIVNARDRTINADCDCIKIDVDRETGYISVWNNGESIPVKYHKVEKKYVPHVIFGVLLTSENYKKKNKMTGGKNGYGAKCTNIYSKEFIVENHDGKSKYVQRFYDNMYKFDEPKIKKSKSKPYVKITFLPDYKRFGFKKMSSDMYSVFLKRCYDLTASTSDTKIYLNGKQLKVRKFEDYIKLYYPKHKASEMVYEKINSRWKVGVVFKRDLDFTHVSFVNGISTIHGGTHVNHVTNQIIDAVKKSINGKKKFSKLKIKPAWIKENIHVFVDCMIPDPAFESQTKEALKTTVSDYGKHKDAKCGLSAKFTKDLLKTGLEDVVINIGEHKTSDAYNRKTDGKKTKNVFGIKKLEDAHKAGTRDSLKCRLFITEGDSAKGFVITGFSVIGQEHYGVYPVRGKFKNVRGEKISSLEKNEVLNDIKSIMGLKQRCRYRTADELKKLRYGGIIIMVDQDVDGSHIAGLVMNMIESLWPDLMKLPGFIQKLNTPIVKVWKKTDKKVANPISFQTITEYEEWVEEKEALDSKNKDHITKWESKYYKGLGTSTDKERIECFSEFEKKLISYVEERSGKKEKKSKKKKKESSDTDSEADIAKQNIATVFNLAFNSKYANDRKKWLSTYDPKEIIIDDNTGEITFSDFIHKDLKHFSMYDCLRSIPDLMDGMKPSHRKVLFAGFRRGRNSKEIKVAQFSGYIAEHTEYHHNEVSLQGTCIGMAQNYVGSNGINLFKPNGNFGTRYENGKDAASARYIFTQPEKIASLIFREEDDKILDYLVEDNHSIEPKHYVPIIPMILINGVQGIATGWSTTFSPFNPLDVIENVRRKVNGEDCVPMMPWFKGFKGTVSKGSTPEQFVTRGCAEVTSSNTVEITELPVGHKSKSICQYRIFLESLMPKNKDDNKAKITDFESNSGNHKVSFTVKFKSGELKKLINGKNNAGLFKLLKLEHKISLKNMTAYNPRGIIQKYDYPEDIIDDFFDERHKMYKKRREWMLAHLRNLMDIIKYKIKYIKHVNNKTIKVKGCTTDDLVEKLEDLKYPRMHTDHTVPDYERSYRYLLSMLITSLTTNKIKELEKEFEKRKMEYEEYKKTTVEKLWNKELDELEEFYEKWLVDSLESIKEGGKKKGKGKGRGRGGKGRGRGKKKK